MENTEFRGMNDGIILYILKSGDRHTDELKSIIDDLFFEIKVGTLYSVITRLKNQKYINEYRSSSDGSRRKYFTLTKSGKDYFEKEFAEKFANAPIVDERFARIIQQPVTKKEPKLAIDKRQLNFQEYVNNVSRDEFNSPIGEIDFSSVTDFDSFNVVSQPNENKPDINDNTPQNIDGDVADHTEEEPTVVDEPAVEVEEREPIVEIPVTVNNSVNPYVPLNSARDVKPPEKREIDYDSVTDTSFEYKSVLNSLFPKKNSVDFNVYKPYNENSESDTPSEDNSANETPITSSPNDFDDIYSYAERDGILIRSSSDTNRYQGSKILCNLLRFHSSIVWYAFVLIEYLLLSLFFSGAVAFSGDVFAKICILTAVVPILSIIVYLLNTRYTVKDLPRFKDVIEIALIIAISAIIIIIAVSSIIQIDYSDVSEIFYSIIVPSLIAVNIPVYYVIKYFLSRLDFYQTI